MKKLKSYLFFQFKRILLVTFIAFDAILIISMVLYFLFPESAFTEELIRLLDGDSNENALKFRFRP